MEERPEAQPPQNSRWTSLTTIIVVVAGSITALAAAGTLLYTILNDGDSAGQDNGAVATSRAAPTSDAATAGRLGRFGCVWHKSQRGRGRSRPAGVVDDVANVQPSARNPDTFQRTRCELVERVQRARLETVFILHI